MQREELLQRISIRADVCFGKPCVLGRRIWVSLILDLLTDGMNPQATAAEYDLEQADILACIASGVEMSRERSFDIDLRTPA